MKVVYHPAVQTDVREILRYYDGISPKLGDTFWNELMLHIDAAADKPERYRFATQTLRRVNLHRFPYHFLYRSVPDGIRIIVVRHHRRHPNRGLARK